MNNAPAAYSNESALNKHEYFVGNLPVRMGTITAAVLVFLLEGGGPLTAMDGIEKFGAVRLGAAIHALQWNYGWPIESVAVAIRKADGLTAYATGYKLPEAIIDEAANNARVGAWIQLFKLEQVRRRAIDDVNAVARESIRSIHDIPHLFKDAARYPYGR